MYSRELKPDQELSVDPIAFPVYSINQVATRRKKPNMIIAWKGS
jgi:hypothetical protein